MSSYFYSEGDASFAIKGLPVKLSFRLSEEPYRSGRPSYFRATLDAPAYKKDQLQKIRLALKETDLAIAHCQDSIHLLESKWSYWNLKQQEWKEVKKPVVLPIPEAALPDLPDTSGLSVPAIPKLNKPTIDSISRQLHSLDSQLEIIQNRLTELKSKQAELKSDYGKLSSVTDHGWTDGIRKVDLGLSTLTPGSLSRNAVPMQGIHVAGTIKKTFYDVASGFTLPNQLFSNQAFDQLINNTGNVFNAGDFFAVNSVRFVSSAAVGYGEREKNAIVVESFYTGRSWNDIRQQQGGNQQTATNVTFYLAPKRLSNLAWNGSVGHSFTNDSTIATTSNRMSHLAYASGITYQLLRWKGQFKAFYRNLGTNYDGWSQGIYLRGAEHAELSYRQAFTKRFSTLLRGAQDKYLAADSTQAVRKTRQGSLEIQWKLSQHLAFVSSYTLLELLNDTLSASESLSHLGKTGLYYHKTSGEWKNSATFDGGYARIAAPDSIQRLLQLSGHIATEWKHWQFGLKATYTHFDGLSRLYGESWCIQPEFGYKGPQFMASLHYQYLKSQQFGTDGGLVFQAQFHISELFTISYLAQRWLPTEYTFFMIDAPGIVKPIYMRWKLTLHLKQRK